MAIDFGLTAAQRKLQKQARAFAKDVLAPGKRDSEALPTVEERFLATKPAYEAMIRAGFLRQWIPAEAGGDGTSLVDTALTAEELYTANASITLTLVGTVLGLAPILTGGTEDQRKRLLAPFLAKRGAPLAAFCSSEPGGSANVASPPPGEGVRTTAKRDGDSWVINGQKRWVSSATGWQRDNADVLCIVCRTDAEAPPEKAISILAVTKPASGVAFETAIETPGHRAHLTPQFRFDNLVAPHANLLGQEGGGLALASASFTGASALVGILGVAVMRAAFDFALNFARTEKRGGVQPIIEHQAVGYALGEAKMTIEAARALSWHACHAVDKKLPAAAELASCAKIFGSEAAVRVITTLMRVVGIESYDMKVPLAGLLQDALVLPIFAGGNMGVRMRALQTILKHPDYDPLRTLAT